MEGSAAFAKLCLFQKPSRKEVFVQSLLFLKPKIGSEYNAAPFLKPKIDFRKGVFVKTRRFLKTKNTLLLLRKERLCKIVSSLKPKIDL
jgi:hypothetical protein